MTLSAFLAGLLSAALFGVLAILVALLGKRLRRPAQAWRIGLQCAGLLLVLFTVPPPLLWLPQLTIVDAGHAGMNFMLPYLMGGLVFIGVAVYVALAD